MRPKIYCPGSFINDLFLQTSEELSTPTVNKSKKKNGGENKSEKIKWTGKQKDIDNFFTAKCKLVDLHVEESVNNWIFQSLSLVLYPKLCFLMFENLLASTLFLVTSYAS